MIPLRYSEARGTLIYEKNLKSKISCQTPFKALFSLFKSGPKRHHKKIADLWLSVPGTPKNGTDCEMRIDQNNLRICD